MKNNKEFEKIEEMYDNYKFLDGKIIILTINSKISKKRYKSKSALGKSECRYKKRIYC